MMVGADRRKRPIGRRAGDSGTRDAILDAASQLFSERGYDGASLRAIAAVARVDPALIRHFFGDKDALFASVVADRTSIFERLAAALPGETATIGHRVADAYLGLWEDPQTRPVLLAITRSAITSDKACGLLQEALGSSIRTRTGEGHEPRLMALAGAHLFGVAMARHVIVEPSISQLTHQELVAHVAPTIQRYLTGTYL